MRVIRVGLISLAILLGVLAILVVALLVTDLGRFKPQIESLASDVLARELLIQGPLHVTVGEEIHVVVEDLRIENPGWASEPALLRVDKLDISLNTWALIQGRYLIENVEVNGIAIHLEQGDDGSNTWTLFGPESEEVPNVVEPDTPLDLLVRQVRVRDLKVTYTEAGRESPLVFQAAAFDQVQLDSGDLQFDLDADINGTPFTLNGTAGTFADLIAAGPAHMDLRSAIGEISISGAVEVDSLADPRSATGELEVSGPNAQYLTDVFGVEPVTQGALNLVASIGPVEGRTDLNIEGEFGAFEINVTGSFADLQDFDDARIDFSAKGPDASTFAALTSLQHIPPDPYSVGGTLRRDGAQISMEDVAIAIGESQFGLSATIANLSGIDGSVAELSLGGPDFGRFNKLLGLPGRLTGPFNLTAKLSQSPDGIELVDITATASDATAHIKGGISTEPDFIGTELTVEFGGGDLSVITDALDIADVPNLPFDVSAAVSRTDLGLTVSEGVVRLGKDELRVDGLVGNQPLESGTDIRFSLAGADLGTTLSVLELDADKVPDGRYEVSGRVYREDDGFVLEQIIAKLGKSADYEVGIEGKVTDADELVGTQLKLSARGRNLKEVAALAEIAGLPAVAFDVSASVERREAGLAISDGEVQLADERLRIEGFVGNQPLERDTDLRFEVSGPDLARTINMAGVEIAALAPGSYEAAGRIQRRSGYFELDDITARLGGTRAELSGRLGELTDFQGTDINLRILGVSLAGLVPENSDLSLADVPYDVTTNVGIADNVLKLGDLAIKIGAAELGSNISVSMSPMLASGRVEISANGPDVSELLPKFSEFVPAGAPFGLDVVLRWQDTHVTIDRLNLKLAKATLDANGEIDVINDLARTNLTLDLKIASMRNVGKIAGTPLPDEPLSLSAQLIGAVDIVRLEGFHLSAGKSDLSGSAAYDIGGEIPRLNLDLTSTSMDLTPFMPAQDDSVQNEAVVAPPPRTADTRVIPDTPIPVDLLNLLNARVDISIGELVLPNTRVENILVDGSLQDGALRIEKFELAGEGGGVLTGQLELLPDAEGTAFSVALGGSEMTLGLVPSSPDAIDELPSYDLDVKLDARGDTVREMAASLDGTVRLVGGSGQVKGIPAWFARDVTAQVMDKVNPFKKKEGYTEIVCVAVLLRSIDGKVDGVPAFVLQTDKLNIVSVAYVDLHTEAIDVKLETSPRKGIGIGVAEFITPYTKISGTLAQPDLVFDTEEAVKRGATTVATLGTLWIAKKLESRFFSDKDPCGTEVLKADEEMSQAGSE